MDAVDINLLLLEEAVKDGLKGVSLPSGPK